jgi:hypothetical protein
MSMCVSPSFPFSKVCHCQHSFSSCSQQLQEGNCEEIATRNFLSSTHRSKADFSLQSLALAIILYCTLCMVITAMLMTFSFWWHWGVNLGVHASKAGALLIQPRSQSIFLWGLYHLFA